MLALAALVLVASSARVALVDEVFQIPASDWRYVPVLVREKTALVAVDFHERSGSPEIRVALLRKGDVERLRGGRPHGMLATAGPAPAGRLRYPAAEPGEYAIVVENGGDRPAAVHLRAWLDFGARPGPAVSRVSPPRQLAVILISFAVFFGIVTWSARTLLRNIGGPGPGR